MPRKSSGCAMDSWAVMNINPGWKENPKKYLGKWAGSWNHHQWHVNTLAGLFSFCGESCHTGGCVILSLERWLNCPKGWNKLLVLEGSWWSGKEDSGKGRELVVSLGAEWHQITQLQKHGQSWESRYIEASSDNTGVQQSDWTVNIM
jgi:hypothetical protein